MHAKMNERKQIIVIIICATLAFLLAVAVGLLAAKKVPEKRIQKIEAALAQKDTARAAKFIARLTDEDAAAAYEKECTYLDAEAALLAQDWEGAMADFGAVGNYKDAAERIKEARYFYADSLAARGEWEEAMLAFEKAAGYSDAQERREECRYEYAGVLARTGFP